MQLIEEQKLSLNDKITDRLPGLPGAWSDIRVSHLLAHTSGIKSYTQLAAIAGHPTKDFTNEEMIALVADLPLEFRPGERYDYSNTGYYLLGMLIEKVSGQKLRGIFRKADFRPDWDDKHSGQQFH